jgi:hypothetical protein
MHHLSDANVRIVQIRGPGRSLQSEKRPAGMCHKVDLLFTKMLPQMVS